MIQATFQKRLIHKLRVCYESSPYPLRRLVGEVVRRLPSNWRYGPVYSKFQSLVQISDYWSTDQILDYQFQELKHLISHAYSHTKYYRSIMDKLGINPDDFRRLEDIQFLPVLTRDEVRNYMEDILADNILPIDKKYVTTGGSSGKPLGFYIDKDSSIIDWALMVKQWERAGYKEGDLRLVLRGRVIQGNSKNSFLEYNPVFGELFISSYHLDESHLNSCIEIINKFRPQHFHAYPSTAMILAQYIRAEGFIRKTTAFPILALGLRELLGGTTGLPGTNLRMSNL